MRNSIHFSQSLSESVRTNINHHKNDEIAHAFGGIVGNGVCFREGDKVVLRWGRVTSI